MNYECDIIGNYIHNSLTSINSRATLARAEVDRVHLALEASTDDFFERSVFENGMAVEYRILFMGDKLDKRGWVMLGAGDHVRFAPASAVDAVSMVTPLVHTGRADAASNPVIGTLLLADSLLTEDEPDLKAVAFGDHRLALDTLPFVAAKANDLDNFRDAFGANLCKVLGPLFGLEDAGAKGHAVV